MQVRVILGYYVNKIANTSIMEHRSFAEYFDLIPNMPETLLET